MKSKQNSIENSKELTPNRKPESHDKLNEFIINDATPQNVKRKKMLKPF